MRIPRKVINGLGIGLLIAIAGASAGGLASQESTPAPDQSFEFFVGFPSEEVPDHTVYVVRFTLQPGGEVGAHSHPGTTMLSVEKGSLVYTLLRGTAHVIRSGSSAAKSIAEPGSDIMLNTGDTVYYEADVIHSARNAGNVPVSVLATHILRNDQPVSISAAVDQGATPAATPVH